LLTGEGLADLGVEPGPKLGELLALVYRAQLNEHISTRDQAMALAKEQIRLL
jgi:hypothetical protein